METRARTKKRRRVSENTAVCFVRCNVVWSDGNGVSRIEIVGSDGKTATYFVPSEKVANSMYGSVIEVQQFETVVIEDSRKRAFEVRVQIPTQQFSDERNYSNFVFQNQIIPKEALD